MFQNGQLPDKPVVLKLRMAQLAINMANYSKFSVTTRILLKLKLGVENSEIMANSLIASSAVVTWQYLVWQGLTIVPHKDVIH